MDVVTKELQGYTTFSQDLHKTVGTFFMAETPTVTAVSSLPSCSCPDVRYVGDRNPLSCLQSLLIQVFIRKSLHAEQW